MKAYASQGNKILFRIARIAIGATVKWDRKVRELKDNEIQAGKENDGSRDKVKYVSRLLACTRCGSLQETRGKQLKVDVGFRAIHCKKCGKQERVHSNKCACSLIWHQCPVHRVDPTAHSSRKTNGKRETGKQTGRKVKLKSSTRAAPTIFETSLQARMEDGKRKKNAQKKKSRYSKDPCLKCWKG